MSCYFQGCAEKGLTKEHIPPRSFFPDGERLQLLTVKSCRLHNNDKSPNDLYVLAQICMNASPANRARAVFLDRVAPQLSHNNDALRKLLARGARGTPSGVAYQVDRTRLDEFFTALSCGIIYKSHKQRLPTNYRLSHIYHQLISDAEADLRAVESEINLFYDQKPLASMAFGNPDTRNEKVYTVEVHGVPQFRGSITVVHRFFGVFKVTSMLTHLSVPTGSAP